MTIPAAGHQNCLLAEGKSIYWKEFVPLLGYVVQQQMVRKGKLCCQMKYKMIEMCRPSLFVGCKH